MKCQKCGNSDVSFHYSSNINGNVTETHLCLQCAAESGYDIEQMFASSQLADLMFPVQGVSGFMSLAIPMIKSNTMFPITVRSPASMIEQEIPCSCGCGKSITRNPDDKVDEEMNLRRELNAQMRAAVEKEEFEKAAELRDRIKELEKTGIPGKPELNELSEC